MIIFASIFGALALIVLLFICFNPELVRSALFRNYVRRTQRIPILNIFSLFKHLNIFDEECAICIQILLNLHVVINFMTVLLQDWNKLHNQVLHQP